MTWAASIARFPLPRDLFELPDGRRAIFDQHGDLQPVGGAEVYVTG
jgi:hypothetical protein